MRDRLDEWLMREYDRAELDNETFSKVYFPGPDLPHSQLGFAERIFALELIKAILKQHYPDGKALLTVLWFIDRASVSLEAWASKKNDYTHRRSHH
ncbi:hypothetical protein LK12_04760 [Novosphingobium malaysiense]|uniref:Uncharacterized protein n=1 Tax=Novosphingobium malaysiense TaxID=1348853 RepID=A0A0B1ZWK0_9SPHN|nr:hypothetical protein LK12_04760 [Novosphingobium malaysiense]